MVQLHAMACIPNICMLFIVDTKNFFNFSVFHSFAIIGYMLNSFNLKHQLCCKIIVFSNFLFCVVQFFLPLPLHICCVCFFVLNLCRILAYILSYGMHPFHSFFHEFTLFYVAFWSFI
jgi:hypothetical protein